MNVIKNIFIATIFNKRKKYWATIELNYKKNLIKSLKTTRNYTQLTFCITEYKSIDDFNFEHQFKVKLN